MTKTFTDLTYRTLRNLGALPQGQSPSNEDAQSINDLRDSTFAGLQKRNVITLVSSTTTFSDQYLTPLGHIMADAARSEYGELGTTAAPELSALAQKAEQDLMTMQRGKVAS